MNQLWIKISGHRLCFCTNVQKGNRGVILFLPGLGQTKAGSYFLYSQISKHFSSRWDTIQFDYYGFGDSAGSSEECDYFEIQNECLEVLRYLCSRYTKIIIISSGFANAMACRLVGLFSNTIAFLLEPITDNHFFEECLSFVNHFKTNDTELIDTSVIYDRIHSANECFWALGEGYNRCKGIYLKCSFLIDMMANYHVDLSTPRVFAITNVNTVKENVFFIKANHISLSPIAREQLVSILEKELKV